MKKIKTVWEVWTYDVWGNKEDGYTVNNRFRQNTDVTLYLTPVTYNKGSELEFTSASPTKRQIQRVFGVRCCIDTDDGDAETIYVERSRDGYPIGEMHCTSHGSLSPIQPVVEVEPTRDSLHPQGL